MARDDHLFGWKTTTIIETSNTPHFTDHCDHGSETYLGSCTFLRGHESHHVDVYVHGPDGQVCARTGDLPGDYTTYGTIFDLIHFPGQDPQANAVLQIVDNRINFMFEIDD